MLTEPKDMPVSRAILRCELWDWIIFLAQYEIFNFTDTGSRVCTARATTTWLSVDTSSNVSFFYQSLYTVNVPVSFRKHI